MARHSKDDKRGHDEVQRLRIKAIEKFFDLSEEALEHIKTSMKATKLCHACRRGEDGTNLPGNAKDLEGLCAFCHGSYLVPDIEQRNWAFEQASDRFAPKPKAMEMSIEERSVSDSIEEKARGLSDDELNKRLSILDDIK